MFKFVVLAALISFVSASGHYEHAPVAHVTNVAVHKTVAVPTVVGYGSKVVGEQVVSVIEFHSVGVFEKAQTQSAKFCRNSVLWKKVWREFWSRSWDFIEEIWQ